MKAKLRAGAAAFGRFWWEFLVGDTPELFIGALLVLGLIALLVGVGAPRMVPVVVLPGLAIALLAATLVRARRGSQ
ncbi:MAG TPA: hypothetical protein VFW71_15155 [Actinomycetota bacterium]|nr:hypothetical protein [Actinomycetota bacterium]